MQGEKDINQLILDVLEEQCENPTLKKLLRKSLRYEVDIWNRYITKTEIESQYQLIIDKIIGDSIDSNRNIGEFKR